jgi:Uma2 family endonuclease
MTIQTRIGMPMDEFIRQYDEAPFELINGERVAIMPNAAEHGETLKRIYTALLSYEQSNTHVVVYSEMPFVLTDTSDWVKGSRTPDVMVYEASRIIEYKAKTPDWKKKPFVLVPDVCIEVISPNDNYLDVDEKVEGYLLDGVRFVWVFNPRKNTVTIHGPGLADIKRLRADESLDGGDILPGFSTKISDIFDLS